MSTDCVTTVENEKGTRLEGELMAGHEMRIERGFHPTRKIKPVNVRVRGRVVHPGDMVNVLRPGYRQGEFVGRFHDGKLVVRVFGVGLLPVTLFLLASELEVVEKSAGRKHA